MDRGRLRPSVRQTAHSHFHTRPARCREINLNFPDFAKINSKWIRGLGVACHDCRRGRRRTSGIWWEEEAPRRDLKAWPMAHWNLPIRPETWPRRIRGKRLWSHGGRTERRWNRQRLSGSAAAPPGEDARATQAGKARSRHDRSPARGCGAGGTGHPLDCGEPRGRGRFVRLRGCVTGRPTPPHVSGHTQLCRPVVKVRGGDQATGWGPS